VLWITLLSCLSTLVPLHTALARAAAPAPHWTINANAWPTHFTPGDTEDEYAVFATNDGSLPTDGSPFQVAIALPQGMIAKGIRGEVRNVGGNPNFQGRESCNPPTLTCTFEAGNPPAVFPGKLYTRDFIRIFVFVEVPLTPIGTTAVFATVSGGGAPTASVGDPTVVSQTPAPFGFSRFSTQITDVAGNPDTQAGSHPYEMTTSLAFNSSFLNNEEPISIHEPKDIEVALPPGLIGDPSAVPKCSQAIVQSGGFEDCPPDTQVGQLLVAVAGESLQTVPVYNVEPPPGQPAELGLGVGQFNHVPMFFHVRSNGDYGLTAQLSNLPEAGAIMESTLSIWGVPADPAHDSQRQGSPRCFSGCASDSAPRPFLRLPTSCPAEGTPNVVAATDEWQNPGSLLDGAANLDDSNWATTEAALPPTGGCQQLTFAPAIEVTPEVAQAAAPSGYTVNLRVPQTSDPNSLATPDLKQAVVTLPAGTILSPAAANGLQSCSGEQFARQSTNPANCPAASQVGHLKITTPLLSTPLEGQVYVGQPECSPCTASDAQEGHMVRLFLQAQGSGVVIKLEGRVSVNQGAGQPANLGQLTTTFEDNPQLPFNELELVLNGGPRASLVNPATCAPAQTVAQLSPWSAPTTPVTASALFTPSGCPGQLPFAPEFNAGTTSNQAGGFSPFVTMVSRPDGNQALSGITVQTPPGLLGMLSRISLCPEPQAALGDCPAASQIGHVLTAAGPGPTPIYLPQAGARQAAVYLTGPYAGAPFGLSVVVPAEAGPFNLGAVVVRAAISVDPSTSQITVRSNPLPEQLDGIPLQLRSVSVAIDREDFIFNPTNCAPLSVAGTIVSAQGATAALSSRFEAANCGVLPFKPSFAASTRAKTSRASGASLLVKVTSGAGQANIGKVKVDLPKSLPSRLTTLQHACLDSVFAGNPASCPAASLVGTATAHTPVFNRPLTGPAYLVSHGGAAFPDLVIVLQGEGVTLDLDGATNIVHGITSSAFRSIPDAPVSTFELALPEGPHSALATNLPTKVHGNLCGQSLKMPTALTGQNGAVIKQTTMISVSGCPRAHRSRKAHVRRSKKRTVGRGR
jgi:hypothetical protein